MSKGGNLFLDKSQPPSQEDEIRRLELEWGYAYLRQDLATLDRIMADNYLLTDPFGALVDKPQNLALIQDRDFVFKSTESDNIRINIDGDTAVVTARSTFSGRYKGWPVSGRYQYTDVFVRRDGRWQAITSHITALGNQPLRLKLARLLTTCHEALFSVLSW